MWKYGEKWGLNGRMGKSVFLLNTSNRVGLLSPAYGMCCVAALDEDVPAHWTLMSFEVRSNPNCSVILCAEGVLGMSPLLIRAIPLLSSSSLTRQGWLLGCYHFSFYAHVGSISAFAGGMCHGGLCL